MNPMPMMPDTELEAVAAQYLGRLLFIFGRLDMNLGLALVNAQQACASDAQLAEVEALRFGDRLKALRKRAMLRHAGDAHALAGWEKWFASADALRTLRNDFVHGRWGFRNVQRQIVHIMNLPGSPNQAETRYTLDEFAAKVSYAEEVNDEFFTVSRKYPIDVSHP
jgi:hypothetical protein